VIRKLEIIGEAVKNLSARIKQARPEIPWKQIAGMRDRLTHDYFGVDLTLVWVAVKRDLPTLKTATEALLSSGAGGEDERENRARLDSTRSRADAD